MPEAPNFNTIYPGGYGQQLKIQRLQQLANALSSQGQQDIQVQPGTRISPIQGLNKMAEALMGGLYGNQAIQEGQQYGQGAQENFYMLTHNGQHSPGFQQQLGTALAGQDTSQQQQSGSTPLTSAAAQGGMPSPTGNPNTDMLLMALAPDKFGEGLLPTNEQKNLQYAYGDTPEARAIEAAKLKNDSLLSLRGAGSTAYDANGRVVASNPTESDLQLGPDGMQHPVMVSSTPAGATAPSIAPSVPGPVTTQNLSGNSPPQMISANNPGANTTPIATGSPMDGSGSANIGIPPAPGGTPNLQMAQATPQAPESATNLGTSLNSPAAPVSGPEYIASLAAKKAGGVTLSEEDAKQAAEAQKVLITWMSNIPRGLQRIQNMRDAAPYTSNSFGSGQNAEGEPGWKQQYQSLMSNISKNTDTDRANTVLQQAADQGVITEMGPMLANMKTNKFMESLSNNASGVPMEKGGEAKVDAINGIQNNWLAGGKAVAASLRARGLPAPSDADIDNAVAAANANVIKQGAIATHPNDPQKYIYKFGTWTPTQ